MSWRPLGDITARGAAALTLCVVYVLYSLPATAQIRPALVTLRLLEAQNSYARGEAQFNGPLPRYRLQGSETTHVTITFSDAILSARDDALNGSQFVTAKVRQIGNDIELSFQSESSLSLRVEFEPRGMRFLLIRNTSPTDPKAGVNRAAAPAAGASVVAVRLRYADVNEVAGILGQALPAETVPITGMQNNPAPYGGGGLYPTNGAIVQSQPLQPAGPIASKVSEGIAIDRRLNAIVITGTPDFIEQTKALLAAIDVPVPSILLEASIVELTESAARNIGVDFSSSGSVGAGNLVTKSLQTGTGEISLQALIYAEVTKGNGN